MSFMLYEDIDNLHNITDIISTKLQENSIVAKISCRLKDPHSILKKLVRKGIGFHQLTDLVAFRIIVDTQEDCYKVLDIINDIYPSNHEKYKDYIVNPKDNGYSSLHIVTTIGTFRRNVEIQVRTSQMHDIAEFGIANHGEYKEAQEARIKKLFSPELLNIIVLHIGLNNLYKLFEQFNWTMSELVAYEQEIKNFWDNFQDNLQTIQDQFIKEINVDQLKRNFI
ncbi:bifunctional (p)ppGpp synthetase/guanosine-3',5'-bis(diphosphate) 3'-pyrophosphohydrolase [Candidatus Tisiphia endosymbiont of Micropterix aruncella]|uniref:bifunctional (p)ppGpp synthetase/guanosine-3',5'-bis(diphosphate) 3'-pyrophosphohydrolase n=1 Tax=Candidatus Tisiphia endosymbiont of Micropterix aruncella TaxID=3066271 RepID=UPI003AA8D004